MPGVLLVPRLAPLNLVTAGPPVLSFWQQHRYAD